ncbi:MAG TPA: hypothetical protein VFT74_19885 [Isosphaeraceae bacterium]|nr:hypothetical protein [Isosphaeraceae bacterium]
MKIKRSLLNKLVKEELAAYLGGLLEAPAKPGVSDAESDKKGKEKTKPQKEPDNTANSPKKSAPKEPDTAKTPKPAGDDPADKGLEKQAAGEEDIDDAEADEKSSSKIGDEVSGKTVQSLTQEPKSKVLPGAQEIVVTFDQIPDPLRILVTKAGDVKFFFRGRIFNTLGESVSRSKKPLKEASGPFANASKVFMGAMSSLGDHNKLSQAHKQLSGMVGQVTDPTEKQQLGSMIGALTGAVDVSTKGAGKPTTTTSTTGTTKPKF